MSHHVAAHRCPSPLLCKGLQFTAHSERSHPELNLQLPEPPARNGLLRTRVTDAVTECPVAPGPTWLLSLAGLDLLPLCVTFLLCFWEIQYGIVAGVLLSGVLLLYSIARPPIKVGFTLPLGWAGRGLLRAVGCWGAGCS